MIAKGPIQKCSESLVSILTPKNSKNTHFLVRSSASIRHYVGPSIRRLVGPHITLKTDYVAIPSRLGLGDPLVLPLITTIT
jgi:hypothetical protein